MTAFDSYASSQTAQTECAVIPGGNRKQDHLLGARFVTIWHQLRDQPNITLDDASLALYLDALAIGIVDQEQMRLGAVGKIALRNVLPVAGEIGESDRLIIHHSQESGRPTAVLDIGLAVCVDGREKDADLCRDEAGKVVRDLGSP
jgi:hypothetical protein